MKTTETDVTERNEPTTNSPPDDHTEPEPVPDLDQMTFEAADAPTVEAYHRGRGYIPATPIDATWRQLVNHVIWKDRDIRHQHGIAPAKDGVCLIPSKLLYTYHDKAEHCDYWRKEKACHRTSLLVLDVEDEPMGDSPCDVLEWYHSYFDASTKALIYSTWHHGVRHCDLECCDDDDKWKPGQPRITIVIPLSRPVHSQDEYPHLWAHMYEYLDRVPDRSCSDPSRASYTFRSTHPDAELEPWWIETGSEPLDVDDLPQIDGDSHLDSEVGNNARVPINVSAAETNQKVSVDALKRAHEESQQRHEKRQQKRREAVESGLLDPPTQGQKVTYFKAALRGICDEVANTEAGARNTTLLKKATKVGAMLQSMDIDVGPVTEVMVKAGCASGLPEDESRDVVARGIRYGLERSDGYDWTRLGTMSDDVRVTIEFGKTGWSQGDVSTEITTKSDGPEEDLND